MSNFILEQFYTIKLSHGELQTLVKAVQCIELYDDQGPDIEESTLTDNEIYFLRKFRSEFNDIAKENLAI